MFLNIYYWEKIVEKKTGRNVQALKSKKVQGIFGKTFVLT